jgi:hypothetical protein
VSKRVNGGTSEQINDLAGDTVGESQDVLDEALISATAFRYGMALPSFASR